MIEVKGFVHLLQKLPEYKGRIKYIKYIPPQPARYQEPDSSLPSMIKEALRKRGIDRLYSHQAQALNLISKGKNVVLTTPAASGKTYTYNLPVFEQIKEEPSSKALYLFPTKALTQDQLKTIRELSLDIDAQIYDGDTSSYQRSKIKKELPNIILSNPDMLHLSILPFHSAWQRLFSQLKFIVLDEIHSYRGIFGSHLSQVIRRLRRICKIYGSSPQFICCSATIANPKEFVEKLTGEEFEVVGESGAPSSGKYFILWEPENSPYTEATSLFNDCLNARFKTIVFTKSRKITELIYKWSIEGSPEYEDKIRAYRAGYLPGERRDIEKKLFEGELLGVISTSALEVGIDVGGLDACILVGYPGSIMSTWQRGGRVGRGGKEAVIVMISLSDAIDKYYTSHPQDFFQRGYESAVLDNDNLTILKAHLLCAAAELPLDTSEEGLWGKRLKDALKSLQEEGKLLEGEKKGLWFSRRSQPQRLINLRSIGETYQIVNEEGNLIGSVEYPAVFRDCHPQAIYLQGGSEYLVTKLDLETKTVVVREVDVDYYTSALSNEEVEILETCKEQEIGNLKVQLGRVKVTEEVGGYIRRRVVNQVKIDEHNLRLPPYVYETEAFWLEVPLFLREKISQRGLDFLGGLHAAEHAIIAVFPLFTLCDRWDLGGVSYYQHPQTGVSTIFIHDAYPGGVGLSGKAYEVIEQLIKATWELVSQCSCEEGCPSCIQSPKCGSGNRPLDKRATLGLLSNLISPVVADFNLRSPVRHPRHWTQTKTQQEEIVHSPQSTMAHSSWLMAHWTTRVHPTIQPSNYPTIQSPQSIVHKEVRGDIKVEREEVTLVAEEEKKDFEEEGKIVFLDIETQKLAQNVGGWEFKDEMRVSVVVTYNTKDEKFNYFTEEDIHRLLDELLSADLVIGFNIKSFDYAVLQPYFKFDLLKLPTLDLLEVIYRTLGFRLSLDHLARVTLGRAKSGNGYQAVAWYREGEMEKLKEYCQKDVEITKELYEFGKEHKYLLFESREGQIMRIPVEW